MSAPLIRTELRRATPERLEELNRARPDALRFLPLEEEVRRLALVSPDRMRALEAQRWAEHPDEIIPILFLRRVMYLGTSRSGGRHGYIEDFDVAQSLCERAVRDAEADGAIWTPLLDALVDIGGGEWTVRHVTRYEERLPRLQRWVRSVGDPSELRVLASFDSPAIRHIQFEHARTIPEDTLDHWIRSDSDAVRVLRNRAIMRRHAPAVVAQILTLSHRSTRPLEDEMGELVSARDMSRLSQSEADRLVERALGDSHFGVLAVLLPKLPQVGSGVIMRILCKGLSHDVLEASALLHPSCPQKHRDALLAGKYGYGRTLLTHPSADAAFLGTAWARLGARVAYEVLSHPNVATATAVDILSSKPPELDDDIPPAVARPRVALAFLRAYPDGSGATVLEALRKGRSRSPLIAAAIQAAMERAWTQYPLGALDQLESFAERSAVPLDTRFFAGMLGVKDAEQRQRLVRLQGRIRPLTEKERAAASRMAA